MPENEFSGSGNLKWLDDPGSCLMEKDVNDTASPNDNQEKAEDFSQGKETRESLEVK